MFLAPHIASAVDILLFSKQRKKPMTQTKYLEFQYNMKHKFTWLPVRLAKNRSSLDRPLPNVEGFKISKLVLEYRQAKNFDQRKLRTWLNKSSDLYLRQNVNEKFPKYWVSTTQKHVSAVNTPYRRSFELCANQYFCSVHPVTMRSQIITKRPKIIKSWQYITI